MSTFQTLLLVAKIVCILLTLAFIIVITQSMFKSEWQVVEFEGNDETHRHGLFLIFIKDSVLLRGREEVGSIEESVNNHQWTSWHSATLTLLVLSVVLALIGMGASCYSFVSFLADVAWVAATFFSAALGCAGVAIFAVNASDPNQQQLRMDSLHGHQWLGDAFKQAVVGAAGLWLPTVLSAAISVTNFFVSRNAVKERQPYTQKTSIFDCKTAKTMQPTKDRTITPIEEHVV